MKNRIAQGFDFLAPVYDMLARWFIGESIVTSQQCFLERFQRCHRILILGGGSGWILAPLCKKFPHLEIDYIDLSSKMIEKAISRVGCNRVNFIQGTEDDIPYPAYDGVITNFYLDMFGEKNLAKVIEKIKDLMTCHSIWIVTDFVNDRKMHAIKLWCMYRFFKIVTRIEATQLSDWQSQMVNAHLKLLETKKFDNGFIVANCYQICLTESHH